MLCNKFPVILASNNPRRLWRGELDRSTFSHTLYVYCVLLYITRKDFRVFPFNFTFIAFKYLLLLYFCKDLSPICALENCDLKKVNKHFRQPTAINACVEIRLTAKSCDHKCDALAILLSSITVGNLNSKSLSRITV